MSRNVVKAKLDIIFKKMFSDKENEDMLHDLLASMLNVPYESIKKIEVLNPDILPESISGKFSRMDIKLQVDDKIINVEMQVKNEGDFRDRSLYYWSKLYSGELKSGEEYSSLKNSIAINIVNFKMFDCEEYHSEFTMLEKTRHEQLSDKCAIHFFELKKIGKNVNKNNRMELWLQLINAESEEELDMIKDTNIPVMEKAVMIIHQMSDDEKIQEIARLREKALHDEASALGNARREGKAEGLIEGEAKGLAKGLAEGKAKGLAEGKAKGLAEGKAKGLAEGKAKGLAEGKAKGLVEGKAKGLAEGKAKGLAEGKAKEQQKMIDAMRLSGLSEDEIQKILSFRK